MGKRIGLNEQTTLNKTLKLARNFKIYKQHKNKDETYFNNLIINRLRENVDIENKNIVCAKFVGEPSDLSVTLRELEPFRYVRLSAKS